MVETAPCPKALPRPPPPSALTHLVRCVRHEAVGGLLEVAPAEEPGVCRGRAGAGGPQTRPRRLSATRASPTAASGSGGAAQAGLLVVVRLDDSALAGDAACG